MKKKEGKRIPSIGRDEMNLCRIPWTTLSTRPPRVNTRIVEDTYRCRKLKRVIKQKWTIEGSSTFGLPTCWSDDIYLALVKVTLDENKLSSPHVEFTLPQLLDEMKWLSDGPAYQRLRREFKRLYGVRIYCQNSWRDNKKKEFVSHIEKGISIISGYELGDARKTAYGFVDWGPVLFKSFDDGYVKRLNLDVYNSFESRAGKRIYRNLDKDFNPPECTCLEYDLDTFAYNLVGSTEKRDKHGIVEALQPGIEEVEGLGMIRPEPVKRRYKRKPGGGWKIEFELNPNFDYEGNCKPHRGTQGAHSEPQHFRYADVRKNCLERDGVRGEQVRNATLSYRSELPSEYVKCLEHEALEVASRRSGNSILIEGVKNEKEARHVGNYHYALWENFVLPLLAAKKSAKYVGKDKEQDE